MKALFLETIRLQDGQLLHLDDHQDRVNRTLIDHTGQYGQIDLVTLLHVPQDKTQGRFKVRVLYRESIQLVEYLSYTIRPVGALQIKALPDDFQYAHKFADRQALESLFSARTYGDDVLMVRHGLLTDTSYANVALFDGQDWYTPAQPLLAGTARARLLREGVLREQAIAVEDLQNYKKLRLINAMMDWTEGPEIAVANIKS